MTIARGTGIAALMILLVACGGESPEKKAAAAPTHFPVPHQAATSLDGCLGRGPGVRFVHIKRGGMTLRGAVLGTGPLGVVLTNQSGANLCGWLPFARKIVAHHHRALLFDGNGAAEEVTAAALTLRASGAKRIVAMGASVGAVASIRAVARGGDNFAGLVSVSGERSIGGDVKPDAQRVRVPALFISAKFDASAVYATKVFYRVASTKDKHLLILPGAFHGESLFDSPQRARVEKSVLSFIDHLAS
jgi:hypothetical protein